MDDIDTEILDIEALVAASGGAARTKQTDHLTAMLTNLPGQLPKSPPPSPLRPASPLSPALPNPVTGPPNSSTPKPTPFDK